MDALEPGVACALALIVSPLVAALAAFLAPRAAAGAIFLNIGVTILAAFGLLGAVLERPVAIALGN